MKTVGIDITNRLTLKINKTKFQTFNSRLVIPTLTFTLKVFNWQQAILSLANHLIRYMSFKVFCCLDFNY